MAFWTHKSTRLNDLQPKLKDRFLVIMGGEDPYIPSARLEDPASGTSPFAHRIMFTVKSIDKPSVDIETKDFKLMNHKFKYPGMVTWNPIKLTLVDMAGAYNRDNFFSSEVPSSRDSSDLPGRSYIDSEIRWDKEFFSTFGSPNFENSSAAMAFLLYGSGYDTPGFTAAAGKSNNTGIAKRHMNQMLQNLTIQQLAVTPTPPAELGSALNANQIWATEQWTLKNPIVKSISWGSLGYEDEGLIEYTIEIDYDFAEVSYSKARVGFILTE